ncbi:conserved hypothetical protein [Theileria equi strain WA]|uniref:Uncharacterized protein n=1 Tax=Theileria equi strain WA TaxID=1537102 RepID=L1LC06_THEEQ|nr:conserved hypothetical protein [Theileria equi strain WA]EKX72871.1 conserved hypothetical protein [Theileria equi strain WA]|eukprot:XP_004832323.1 conserved hypothetical protein [Theileria equi strain WA]
MNESQNFENAYNASRQPITGFSVHRMHGVEQYKKQDHFLYLKQFEKDGKNVSATGNPHFRMNAQKYSNMMKLERVSQMVPKADTSKIWLKSRRYLSISILCSSISFAIACTIGAYF